MRRAQVSVEFLAITAIAMLILTSSTYLLFQYSRGASEQGALQQAAEIGFEIVDQAKSVYVFGADSFVTVRANMPREVTEVYTVNDGVANNVIVFVVDTKDGQVHVPIFSDVELIGVRADGIRTHVNGDDGFGNQLTVHPGRTEYRITSLGSNVEIRQIT